ncbi:hypothetical protein Droror1_Dr00012474 [Drosera rotundifolia]
MLCCLFALRIAYKDVILYFCLSGARMHWEIEGSDFVQVSIEWRGVWGLSAWDEVGTSASYEGFVGGIVRREGSDGVVLGGDGVGWIGVVLRAKARGDWGLTGGVIGGTVFLFGTDSGVRLGVPAVWLVFSSGGRAWDWVCRRQRGAVVFWVWRGLAVCCLAGDVRGLARWFCFFGSVIPVAWIVR